MRRSRLLDQEECMPSVKARSTLETTLAAIVAHPLRVKCLSILAERTASPNQISRELKADVGNVSYHVKVLRELGVVELVDEKKVRGAVEHFYKATTRAYVSDSEWTKLTPVERRPYSLYTLQLVMADAAAAMEAGTFDSRDDRYLTRTPALVDPTGWEELNKLHEEMLDRTLEIQAASADRMNRSPGGESIPVMSIAMFFERAPRTGKS
jgi:DNA-binding transcriptional ArsR family regulator